VSSAAARELRPVEDEVLREVERFLYWEARLLDERRFHDWLELFSDDAHYWMPVRRERSLSAGTAEFADESGLAFFDEDKESLRSRVQRLDTGMAWAEEPPSRTRHLVTNIEVFQGDSPSQVLVFANFQVYRTRLETKQDFFLGSREDTLRKESGSWKIARRKILIDQTVLSADNLSIFF